MIQEITSTSNSKIKKLVALQQKSSERRESALFVVEGRRELKHCLDAGYSVEAFFVLDSAYESLSREFPQMASGKVFVLSRQVYEKIAYREGTEGIVAEVHAKALTLEQLRKEGSPLYVVLESVEKPGNLGAVLRSADAAGADGVIICDPLTDLYNPNLIRASIGAVFTVPCVACSSQEAIRFFKENSVSILTAQLQDSSLYYDCDMRKATAIVMGTESSGLPRIWREAADAHIRIPMLGQLDSLNVSVSAAILLFESVRQRNG